MPIFLIERNFAEQLQEGFLGQILCFRRIAHHAQAQGVHAPAVHAIDEFERLGIALLGQPDGVGFRPLAGLVASGSGHSSRQYASAYGMRFLSL